MTFLGRIPFLVSYIPFNILINKIKVMGTIDQMPAIKVAISFLKVHKPDLYIVYTRYLKEVKTRKSNTKSKSKRHSK